MVVEIVSQEEPGLTAPNQEADHQKQDRLEGIRGIGGEKVSLRADNPSFSPRYGRLQKSATHAVLSRSKYVVMKQKNNLFFGGCGVVSSATVVTGLVTLDRAQRALEGSSYCAEIPNLETLIKKKKTASVHLLLRSGSVQHYWNEIFYFVHHLAHKFIR